MVPEDGVAVVAGTHNAVLGQPEAGEVGEVAMGHCGSPGGRRGEGGQECFKTSNNIKSCYWEGGRCYHCIVVIKQKDFGYAIKV